MFMGNMLITINFLDSVFDVWTGGYCCPGEKVTVLVCIVKGGYHSISQYQWYCNQCSLSNECNPILYTTQCGIYKCQVVVCDSNTKVLEFIIEGSATNHCTS